MSIGDVLTQAETLPQTPYQSQDLARLLESLRQQQVSGTLQLEVEIQPSKCWQRILLWYQGEITYGGYKSLDRGELVRTLIQKFKPEYVKIDRTLVVTATSTSAFESRSADFFGRAASFNVGTD